MLRAYPGTILMVSHDRYFISAVANEIWAVEDGVVRIGITAYAIAANVCYSLGAPAELLLERWLGRQTYAIGPALFRYGLIYSVGLTLFPLALGAFAVVAKLLFHFLH